MEPTGEPPVEPAQRPLAKVIEVLLIEDRLDGEGELRELRARLNAVRDRDERDLGVLEQACQPEHLGSIAGEAREIIDQQDVKRAGRGGNGRQEPLVGGPVLHPHSRQRLVGVGVLGQHLPPGLPVRIAVTGELLVRDGRRMLDI